MRKAALAAGLALIAACDSYSRDPAYDFLADVREEMCGNTYRGRVVSDQPVDADWIGQTLTLGPMRCQGHWMEMPLAVGEDSSRTWRLRKHPEGAEFRHRHVEPDGQESDVSNYGGTTTLETTSRRLVVPADEITKAIFLENGLEPSVANVWSLTLEPGQTLTYALARPGRDFRAEFDISESISPPGGD